MNNAIIGTAASGSGNGTGTAQSPPQGRPTLPATNQIDQIAAFNQTYKNAASNVTIQAIDPIVTDLQANKILWLALHDIPQRSIAFETRFDYKKRKPRTKLEEHIETISEFIGLALGAIARSGDPNPDTAVSNLIAFAGANFDPRGLTRRGARTH